MKAAVYADKNVVEVREVPELTLPGSEYVKAKIEYCNICATDVHIVSDGLYGLPFGHVLGHEAAGTLVEVGEKAAALGYRVGDRVAFSPARNCGSCYYCRNGQIHYCQQMHTLVNPGAMAEYGTYHVANLFKIPDEITFKEAAILEPLASVMHGFDLTKMRAGTRVAISGAGGIGLLHLVIAKMSGAVQIAVIEPVEEKRQLALELGADYVIDPKNQNIHEEAMKHTNGRGYDYVFEASGVPAAAPPCLEIIGNQGKITYFAVFPGNYNLPVNLYKLYEKEVTIHAVFAYQHNFERAMQTIPAIREELKKIVSKEFDLNDAVAAFKEAKGSVHPKITIKC